MVASVIMSCVGLAFVVGGGRAMLREHKFIRDGHIVEGRVTALVSRPKRGDDVQVSFTTADGREVDLIGAYPPVRIGAVIPVAYDPVNPKGARLLYFGARFGRGYCAIALGLLLLFYGVGFNRGDSLVQWAYLPRVGVEQR